MGDPILNHLNRWVQMTFIQFATEGIELLYAILCDTFWPLPRYQKLGDITSVWETLY